jgi:hypothetical protein
MSVSSGHSIGEVGLMFAGLLLIVVVLSLLAMVAIPPMVTFLSPSPDTGTQHGETVPGKHQ